MKSTIITLLLLCFIIILQNCSSSKKVTVKNISFDKDIMPIMQTSCTPCHFPPGGNKEPLDNYAAVKKNFTNVMMRVKLSPGDAKFMPFKSKKPPLSDSIINVLSAWEKQGMLQ